MVRLLSAALLFSGCATANDGGDHHSPPHDGNVATEDASEREGSLFANDDAADLDTAATALDAADSITPNPDSPEPDTGTAPDTSAPPCTTTITYGPRWIHGPSHPSSVDVATGLVTWDATCTSASTSSYAVLSNGWKPYFNGAFSCTMAFDDSCGGPSCRTRIMYGASWLRPAAHPAQYDDTLAHVTWDGICHVAGVDSYAVLSNGWKPYFKGTSGCAMAFSYVNCGGL